jgi:hypothetical protein
MTGESRPFDTFSERHVSPDGRTILELMNFDWRDVHEMQPFLLPRVTDAATGQVVLDLTNVLMSSRFQWEPDGALSLKMSLPWESGENCPAIRIVLAKGTYATNADGWTPHPIGEAQAKLPAFVKPPPPETPSTGQRLWRWIMIAAGLSALVLASGSSGAGEGAGVGPMD